MGLEEIDVVFEYIDYNDDDLLTKALGQNSDEPNR